jgi:hypothetical protein
VEAKAVANMQERRLKIGTKRAELENHRKEKERKKRGELKRLEKLEKIRKKKGKK